MTLSSIASEIAASPTLALNEMARQLKERGEPVIHLGAGEPKSMVPFDAILTSVAKIISADIRYTPTQGIPALIDAIVKYTERNYDQVIDPKNVIVSAGAKQAIYNLMMTILNPDDEVIILCPYWVSYPEIVKMLYGQPVFVMPPQGKYQPDIKDIIEKIGPKTKAIIVNSPNNPSGAIYSPKLIGELVELCEDKGIYLVSDDIYHRLVFPGATWTSCYKYAKKDLSSSPLVIINGVSKMYAMTGFRIGWTIANREVTKTMINVAAQNTSCPSIVQQSAAVGALNGIQDCVGSLRLTLENNRNIIIKELSCLDKVRITPPDGTFYCLPDFSAYDSDSSRLSKFLLEKALVVSVPGSEFGMEGHLRLSYCGSVKEIIAGIDRIKWALDTDSPDEIYFGDRKMKRDWA